MRILHTSDWHLGRAFHGVDMLPHQAAYLDHLLEVVDSEAVDLVVVAGDIYDRGLPPVDAVSLASSAFGRLARSRAQVVISSGNHDSARRLGFASDLIAHAGIHLCTDASRLDRPVIMEDSHGQVAIYGIPYLDPEVCKRDWSLATRSHEASLTEAMNRVQADLATRNARSIVLAHAFVAGGQPSDSERDISVGGVDRVPVGVFESIDYVALGHLHGQQTLRENIRYSGSPLAYSFSEAKHHKGSWLIDLGVDGIERSDFIAAPVPRLLARIQGDLEELLGDPSLTEHEDSWIQATLTDTARPLNAMDRLRKRFPHALALSYLPAQSTDHVRPHLQAMTDHDLVLQFVEHARGTHASEAESALIADALAGCCEDPDADPAVSA